MCIRKKRFKRLAKIRKFSRKRIIVFILSVAFVSMPVAANGDVLVTVYPHFTLPLGKETHNIDYGFGAGTKIVYKPIDYFQFGVTGDFYNFTIQNLKPISLFDIGLTAGYVLPLSDRFSINLDLDAGLYRAAREETLSGVTVGASVSLSYKMRSAVSLGGGAAFHHYTAGDTALVNGLSFLPNVTFNLSQAFGKKSNLQMRTKEVLPVFPVLYSWYDNNRFATIEIINEEDYAIENVKVSFYQPQYMGQPKICYNSARGEKVQKGESLEVNLTAFFNERMLEMTEKTDQNSIVSVEYTCLGEKRVQEFSMTIPVYGRNSMSWADDRRAAVFVSSKDPAAMFYSKYVSSVVRENMRIGVPENIQFALGIFNSLADFGINYVIDPSSAYTDNVGTETPDFLQFPYQTLSYRGGDCDDLSILMCSLLEAIGIDTAFITIPGHIYMAFNSGLSVSQAKQQFDSLENFILLDDEVWVPLEITLTDEGFYKAWRTGAREWRVAERTGEAAIYKMKDSWQIYKPVNVPAAETSFSMLEKNEIALSFRNEIDSFILREIEQKITAYKTYIARTGDMKARNALGALYGKYGLFDQAKEQLSYPVRNGDISAMINTANVYFAEKDYETAEKMYKNIIRRDRRNALAYLGVARCCYEQDNFDECDLAYNKAKELDEELVESYTYLGAFENTTGRAFNLADRLNYTIWPTDEIELSNLILDNSVAERVAELEDLYGSAANALIEKTKANSPHLPRLDFDTITQINPDGTIVSVPTIGLPNQLSIATPDEVLALLNSQTDEALPPKNALALLDEPKQDALPPKEPFPELSKITQTDNNNFSKNDDYIELPNFVEEKPYTLPQKETLPAVVEQNVAVTEAEPNINLSKNNTELDPFFETLKQSIASASENQTNDETEEILPVAEIAKADSRLQELLPPPENSAEILLLEDKRIERQEEVDVIDDVFEILEQQPKVVETVKEEDDGGIKIFDYEIAVEDFIPTADALFEFMAKDADETQIAQADTPKIETSEEIPFASVDEFMVVEGSPGVSEDVPFASVDEFIAKIDTSETPKVETPKVETPKVETQKIETSEEITFANVDEFMVAEGTPEVSEETPFTSVDEFIAKIDTTEITKADTPKIETSEEIPFASVDEFMMAEETPELSEEIPFANVDEFMMAEKTPEVSEEIAFTSVDEFMVAEESPEVLEDVPFASVDEFIAKIDTSETLKVETPKVETPKVETPKVETPKVETQKIETSEEITFANVDEFMVAEETPELSEEIPFANVDEFMDDLQGFEVEEISKNVVQLEAADELKSGAKKNKTCRNIAIVGSSFSALIAFLIIMKRKKEKNDKKDN